MPDADGGAPRAPGYFSIAAAVLVGLVAVEEAATKLISGAPALWAALEGAVTPDRKVRPKSQPDTAPAVQQTFDLVDYLGDWRNRDPNTRGITRLWIHKEGSILQVQVWGSCHPADCDWGTTVATAFAKGVTSPEGTDIVSVEAPFKSNFSESRLIIRLAEKSTVTVEASTHFTDKSGRSDYRSTDSLLRAR